jgi:Tol biopolymer transport system component
VLLAAARARKKRERRVLAVLAAAMFLVTLAVLEGVAYWGSADDSAALQFRVPVAGLSPSDIAISPDGRQLALVAKPDTQQSAWLYVRQVNSTEFQRLTGTQDAAQPFWSPDSRSIGFTAGGRLKRVDATGGAPKDLGEAPGFTGGAWGSARIILFGSPKGLYRVSDEGGKPELITTLEKQETGHFWPAFLPDGQHYLYLAWAMDAANRGVFSGSLASKEKPAKLMAAETNVQYADPGFLLFHREATLFAQPFDAGSLKLSGDPLHIADQLGFSSTNGRGNFDVSQEGALVYFQDQGAGGGGPTGRSVTNDNFQWGWVNRASGRQQGELAGEQNIYGDMDLSPDEKLIAVTQSEAAGASSDIWVIDWQNAGRSYRVTLDPGDNFNPVWERPNGNRIAFTTYRKGNADIYIKNANATGPETPLLDSSNNEFIEDWSKDGRYIVYKLGPEGSEDIWAYSIADKKAIPIVEGPYRKDEPQFSYDGKWLAYTSDESAGVFQVYVVSFPGREQKIKVSKDGGGQPRWREDGKELFFRSETDNQAMVVDIKIVDGKISAGVPRSLFTAPQGGTTTRNPTRHQWAVTRDGQRFLIRVPGGQVTAQGGQVTATGVPFQSQTQQGQGQAAPNNQAFVSSGLTVIRNFPAAFQKEKEAP